MEGLELRRDAMAKGAKCEECPLADAGAYVPSQIPQRDVKLAVVGEAPGFQEQTYGRPFVGPSGKLLWEVLDHYGYAREEVMLTNACLCRPAGNATPPRSAVAACRGRLYRELRDAEPDDVLALGGTATSLLVDDPNGIARVRVGPPKVAVTSIQRSDDPSHPRVIPTWHPAYCVTPSTRILTSDLRWLRADEVEVGQELVGFDEHVVGAYGRRMFKPTTTTATERLQLPTYEVETSKGVITCSSDHMWLARKRKSYYTKTEWIRTENLTPEYDLFHFIDPWETLTDYAAGWVSGILDGEGWLSDPNGLGWGQNDGAVADLMLREMEKHGFVIGAYDNGTGPNFKRYNVTGPRESLRAVGMYRPVRLLSKADKLWQRQCSTKAISIQSVKSVGLQEVVSITTTEHTFIAEGFLSHNCLRTADAFPAFVTDIGKLRESSHEPWSPPEWRSFDDPEIALQVLEQLGSGSGPLVVDIEVGIEKDTAFDHPNEYDMLCVGIAYDKRRAVVLGEAPCHDRRVLDRLGELLKSRRLVAHNGKFDLAGLYPHLGALQLWFDTMLASYVLDERPGNHGLKMLAVEKLGAPQYDAEIHKYVPKGGNYADIPRPILYKYNAYDVACTWDLMELFAERMEQKCPDEFMGFPVKAKTLRDVHDFLVAASNQLMYPELNGIAIDRQWSDTLTIIFMERIGGIEEKLNQLVTDSKYENDFINPRSPQQVKAFYEAEGIRVKDTTADTLETLQSKLPSGSTGHEFTSQLLIHRRQAKLYSTYVKGIRRRMYRGRVYTTYLLHGSTSGRLASRNPNLQNIVRDKEIKRQFSVSKPENVFIHCDYKQAEGRVVATLAQDSYLQSVFSSGEDLFTTLGMGLYQDRFDHSDKDQRVRIKAYFYGMAYGREAYSIAMEYGLPVSEAERGLAEFRALIPDVVNWQKRIRRHVLDGKDLITPFGRHRRFYLITDQNQKDVLNEALSFLPQSTSSDICLSALIKLRPMLKGKAFLRLTIHDALVFETHESRKEEVAEIIRQEMIAAGRDFTDYVPFDVDVSYGKNWSEL